MLTPREPNSLPPTLIPGAPATAPGAHEGDTPAETDPVEGTLIAPMPSFPSFEEGEGAAPPSSPTVEGTLPPDSTPAVEGTMPDFRTTPDLPFIPPVSAGVTGTRVGRFALKELHAKGGLGEVFTARDTELNRDVALKRIQIRFADDPSSRRRFLSEAELTARLDHPGVVPVFGLVTDNFGRPCYAMRFIRGETLKDEIDRYHQARGKAQATEKTEKSSSAEAKTADSSTTPWRPASADQPRSVAFRHLLQRFIAVCQAIAYSHTRKIIHRDIKPANVMVGTFGETLVVDWGLAKSLDESPSGDRMLADADEMGFRHDPDATELPDSVTQAGTALGTPSYMAPEQASGNLELVGPAADVYSLGATLFVILTGKTAFSGTIAETLDKVRRGDFPAPRTMNSEAPAPLDAVVRKAMSLNPTDRYRTALDLAADVERWLSDEPVSCYRDPLPARLARWARRNPARVAAGMSLLLAGVLAVAGVAWAISVGERQTAAALVLATDAEKKAAAERDRATDAEKKTGEERDRVAEEKKNTEKERLLAVAARKVAQQRYELAVEAFNTLVTDIQEQLADRAGTQELRKKLLEQAEHGLTALTDGAGAERIGADRTLVLANRKLGDVYRLLGDTRKAREKYRKAVDMAVEVLATKPADRKAKQELGRSRVKFALIHLQAGDTGAARKECEASLILFRHALDEVPTDREASADLAGAQDLLSEILMERGEITRAAEACLAGLTTRRDLAKETPSDLQAQRSLAESLGRYAEVLLRSGRTPTGSENDPRAIAIEALKIRQVVYQKLATKPDVRRELANAHGRLGDVYFDRGNFPGAHKEYEAGLHVLKALVVDDPRSAAAKSDLAETYSRVAAVHLKTGNLDLALRDAITANDLCKKLDDDDHDSTWTTRDLAESYEQLGDVLLVRGKATEALAAYIASAAKLVQLANSDIESAQARRELARALEKVGEAQLATGNIAAAVSALTDSVDRHEGVLDVDHDSARAKRELAASLGSLSGAHRLASNHIPARATVTREVTLLRQVVDTDGGNIPARRELATATGKWGDVLAEGGRPTAALMAVSKSLDQFRALSEADKDNTHIRAEAATAWERLAGLYAAQGQTEPAMNAANSALALRTDLAKRAGETRASKRELAAAMIRFADTYAAVRQFDLARKWYKSGRELVAPDPNDPATDAVARRADSQLALLTAVEAIIKDPLNEVTIAPELRVPAMRAGLEWLLKGNQAITAGAIASQLAAAASTSDDRYAAARSLARCAVSTSITEPAQLRFADEAVQVLAQAVKDGFRAAELLTAPEWDSCRNLPAFQKVLADIKAAKPIAPAPRPAKAIFPAS